MTGIPVQDQFTKFNFGGVRGTIYCAKLELAADGLENFRIAVPDDENTLGRSTVQVFISVKIPNPGAFCPYKIDRVRLPSP